MVLVKSFCCVYPLRTGTIFAGFYAMVSSALFIGLLLVRYLGFVEETKTFVNHTIMYVTMGLYALYIVTCAIMPMAVHKRVTWLIVLWVLAAIIIIICYSSGIMCWVLMDQHDKLGRLLPWELGITFYHAINIIITVYLLLCVFSHLQTILEKKDRRRRRHDSRHVLYLPGAGGGVIAVDPRDTDLYLQHTAGIEHQVEVEPVSPPDYTSELPPAYSTLPRDQHANTEHARATRQNSGAGLVDNEVEQAQEEVQAAGTSDVSTSVPVSSADLPEASANEPSSVQVHLASEGSGDENNVNEGVSLDSIEESEEYVNSGGALSHEPRIADEDIPYVIHSLGLAGSHNGPMPLPAGHPQVIVASLNRHRQQGHRQGHRQGQSQGQRSGSRSRHRRAGRSGHRSSRSHRGHVVVMPPPGLVVPPGAHHGLHHNVRGPPPDYSTAMAEANNLVNGQNASSEGNHSGNVAHIENSGHENHNGNRSHNASNNNNNSEQMNTSDINRSGTELDSESDNRNIHGRGDTTEQGERNTETVTRI